ncbi:MAG: sulfite exporter TauE/SafE family protein [Magnetococcales bacterium]|nr:sulfite exporter TauE/SafE family protein [Magnetococcales bacterium]
MLITSQLFEFFVVGLLTSTHCLVMCGGIVGALTISLPIKTREDPRSLFIFLVTYSIGRILSYAVAGFLAGLFGELLVNSFSLQEKHAQILFALSTFILVGIGLYIAGWLPEFARLEKLGARLWKHIEPKAQSLLPVESKTQALFLGFLWGWLPCGMTYSVLIWSALLGDAFYGAIAMAVFGLGTVPGILTASYFSGRFHMFKKKELKRGLGIIIIILALVFGFIWSPHHSDQHMVGDEVQKMSPAMQNHEM